MKNNNDTNQDKILSLDIDSGNSIVLRKSCFIASSGGEVEFKPFLFNDNIELGVKEANVKKVVMGALKLATENTPVMKVSPKKGQNITISVGEGRHSISTLELRVGHPFEVDPANLLAYDPATVDAELTYDVAALMTARGGLKTKISAKVPGAKIFLVTHGAAQVFTGDDLRGLTFSSNKVIGHVGKIKPTMDITKEHLLGFSTGEEILFTSAEDTEAVILDSSAERVAVFREERERFNDRVGWKEALNYSSAFIGAISTGACILPGTAAWILGRKEGMVALGNIAVDNMKRNSPDLAVKAAASLGGAGLTGAKAVAGGAKALGNKGLSAVAKGASKLAATTASSASAANAVVAAGTAAPAATAATAAVVPTATALAEGAAMAGGVATVATETGVAVTGLTGGALVTTGTTTVLGSLVTAAVPIALAVGAVAVGAFAVKKTMNFLSKDEEGNSGVDKVKEKVQGSTSAIKGKIDNSKVIDLQESGVRLKGNVSDAISI